MAKVKCEVLVKSYIDNQERYPGDVVMYEGKIGSNLRVIKDKEKPVKQMDHDELVAAAENEGLELKDPQNTEAEEIRRLILEKREKDNI